VETLATSRILTASKKTFKSARAAWASIGKRTGLEPSDVKSAGHTRTQWRWKTSNSNSKRTKSVATKRRSVKQRANDKRLGMMARARGRKSAPKRRRKAPARKTIKRRVSKPSVKRRTTHKRSITSKIPFVNNPTIRKVATGIGLATLGVTALNFVAPSLAQNPVVKPALAFLGGGIPGVIGQVVVQGGLGALTGSRTNGGGDNAGFA